MRAKSHALSNRCCKDLVVVCGRVERVNKKEDKARVPAIVTARSQRHLAQTGPSARLVAAISVGGMAYRKDVPAPP